MAEERLIDDDKDRKYKIRINEDGEEELVIDGGDEDEESDIPVFDIPAFEEDDEEAAILTPEQLAERQRLKREEEEARAAKTEEYLSNARNALGQKNFEAALYEVNRALELTETNGDAYLLKLKILTRNLTTFNPLEECAEVSDGVKEYVGADGKAELMSLSDGLEKSIAEKREQTENLDRENAEKKAERRQVFAAAKTKALSVFLLAAVPFTVLLIAAIVFSTMMFSAENGAFLIATIVLGALAFIALICTLVAANRLWRAVRNVKLNELDASTKLGREYAKAKNELELLERIYNSFKQ